MRTGIVGAVLLVVGGGLVVGGVLPPSDALAVGARVWPILLFVVAITVVTELAAAAGLFAAVASRVARWAGGRAWVLWLLVIALATASTVFLSLDTTAVLLTPIVVVLAQEASLDPVPFAFTTVWLANTGSLLLPVSNLTNLLAQHELGDPSPAQFAAMTAAPAAIAVIIPCLLVFLVFRRDLVARFDVVPRVRTPARPDARLLVSAVVVVALIAALTSGVAVWIPACVAALILLVAKHLVPSAGSAAASRSTGGRDGRPVWRMIPWALLLLAAGLFLVVEALHEVGLDDALALIAPAGSSPAALLGLTAAGAVASNAVNNLPAYLALEPVAGAPDRLVAVLIGVNVGPLVTPWASLATLLWHDRLRAVGVDISWRRYVLLGLILTPCVLVGCWAALVWTVR